MRGPNKVYRRYPEGANADSSDAQPICVPMVVQNSVATPDTEDKSSLYNMQPNRAGLSMRFG